LTPPVDGDSDGTVLDLMNLEYSVIWIFLEIFVDIESPCPDNRSNDDGAEIRTRRENGEARR